MILFAMNNSMFFKAALFTVLTLCVICGCKSNQETIERDLIEAESNIDSTQKKKVTINHKEAILNKIELELFGNYIIKENNTDSVNEYGAGDCWGKVIQYNFENFTLGIDSFFCGDSGFNFKFYLMNKKGSLIKLRELNWENIEADSSSYIYLLTEKVFDYETDSPTISLSADTLVQHFYKSGVMPNKVNKPFTCKKLKNAEFVRIEQVLEYNGAWEMDLEN
ncbi:MAG: hypothetical protein ACPGLV_03815 [Bacteroidia bacterium]